MIEKLLDQSRISQYQGYQKAHSKVVQAEDTLRAVLSFEAYTSLTELTDAYAALEEESVLASFREGVIAGIALALDLNMAY